MQTGLFKKNRNFTYKKFCSMKLVGEFLLANLEGITILVGISATFIYIIVENIVFILLLKAVVLVLTLLGYSGMWLAIFADVGVALLAVLNSLRAMITPRKLKNNAKGKDNKAVKKTS